MQDIIIRAICLTLLHSLWQGLLLAATAGILMMATKHYSSATRYKLLCSLLVIFIAITTITFYRQIAVTVSPVNPVNFSAAVTEPSAFANESAAGSSFFSGTLQKAIAVCTWYLHKYDWIIVLIWFFIFLFHFVQLLLGLVNTDRMRYYKTSVVTDEWNNRLQQMCIRLQLRKPVLLMESALLKIPVLIGYVRPVILIPAGMLLELAPEQVEAILLHELAHVRRHDYLVNLIQNAIDTIFFFNPAVLWISSLIRNERENCCDDIAIGETRSRKQFIEALVSFNRYSNTISTCSLSWINGKNQLLHRVQRIINRKNHGLHALELLVLMAVLLFSSSAFIILRHNRNNTSQHIEQPVKPLHTHNLTPQINKPAILPARSISESNTVSFTNTQKPKQAKTQSAPNSSLVSPFVVSVPFVVAVKHEVSMPEISVPVSATLNDEQLQLQKQLQALGYDENNAARLQTFIDHGVTPGYIKSITELGYSNVSMNQLLELKDHGVNADFVTDLKKQGYGTVSIDKAITLIDHGVRASFIESFRQLGFAAISLDEAITLKDHGVSSKFVEALIKKTGHLLSLEDYIKIRDSGIIAV